MEQLWLQIGIRFAVPPKISRDGLEFSPRLPADTTLTLPCEVIEGKPTPTLQWYKDDQPLNATSSANFEMASQGKLIQVCS